VIDNGSLVFNRSDASLRVRAKITFTIFTSAA
jgi:hypothetical protein